MMPRETYTFFSSRIVKEIARLGGDVMRLCRRTCGGAAEKAETAENFLSF